MKAPTCSNCFLKDTGECSFHQLVSPSTTCSVHPGWVEYVAATVESEERKELCFSENPNG